MATSKKKRNLLILGLIALTAVLVVVAAIQGKNRKTGVLVETEKAETRTIKETVEASGKIFPKTEVKISSDVSGEIVELYVKEGDSVTMGQVLARVDPEAYNSQVDRAAAGVNSSKAGLANAKAQIESARANKEQLEAQLSNAREIHKRNEKLFKDGVVSQQDFDASLTTVRQLESNVKAAEANIRSAQQTASS
ncbi:MAG: biotin/lipoyl-binding protein, partial [Saprospiraceae bacterium]|nr:biotin/lipoyl-binding protein [Saprospiraceae bacterium]